MPLAPNQEAAWSSKETFLLAGLLLTALAVRLPHLMTPYVINPDAIHYIDSAKVLVMGKWMEGFQASHVSIFPVLIALVEPISGDWIWAARGIPILFGFLTVIPLYLIARKLLSWPWAALPPLLYCLCPSLTHYSMDVIREPISWFILFTGLWILLKAQQSGRPVWFLGAGAVILLGAANRLDGLVALGAALAWLVGMGLGKGGLLTDAIKKAILFVIPSAAALSVLLVILGGALREQDLLDLKTYRNQIKFSLKGPDQAQKARMEAILEGIPQPRLRNLFSAAWDNRHTLAALELIKHWIKATHPALLALSLLGLFAFKGWRSEEFWWLMAILITAWLVLGYIRLSGAFAISKRHLGPAVLSGYFFAALGFLQACTWAAEKSWGRFKRGFPAILVFALGVLTLPWTLEPQRQDKLVRRLAGEWIMAQGVQKPLVAADNQIVAFYSGGSWLPTKELLGSSAAAPDFLVLEKEGTQLGKVVEAMKRAGINMELLHEVSRPSNPTLLIYGRKTSPSSSGPRGSIGGDGYGLDGLGAR